MLKSGSEFREFSVLTVKFPSSIEKAAASLSCNRPDIDVMHCKVTQDDHPDEAVLAIVHKYLSKVSCHWVT